MDIETMNELHQLFDFFREIDKEKLIIRQTYITGAKRLEDDAEHAWHMAVMTVLLAKYSNEPIDVLKTVKMLLIHDLVEIDAGDTYAYSGVSKETQHGKEEKGARRIFGMLPQDHAGGKSWKEHGVSLSQIYHRNELTPKGSRMLWDYVKESFLKPNVEKGTIKKDREW